MSGAVLSGQDESNDTNSNTSNDTSNDNETDPGDGDPAGDGDGTKLDTLMMEEEETCAMHGTPH